MSGGESPPNDPWRAVLLAALLGSVIGILIEPTWAEQVFFLTSFVFIFVRLAWYGEQSGRVK